MAPTMAHTIQHCPLLFPVDFNHVFLAPLQVACRARPLSVIFCPEGSWISNFRDSARGVIPLTVQNGAWHFTCNMSFNFVSLNQGSFEHQVRAGHWGSSESDRSLCLPRAPSAVRAAGLEHTETRTMTKMVHSATCWEGEEEV